MFAAVFLAVVRAASPEVRTFHVIDGFETIPGTVSLVAVPQHRWKGIPLGPGKVVIRRSQGPPSVEDTGEPPVRDLEQPFSLSSPCRSRVFLEILVFIHSRLGSF